MIKAGKPLVLMILDGWGMKQGGDNDALSLAQLPNFDHLWNTYPHTQLDASGMDVGLPEGQMGNSEVGHMNIGAGRVVYQDYTRINMAVDDGSFFKNPAFLKACSLANEHNGAIHLVGLASDGGVHSHLNHLLALIKLAKEQNVGQIYIHCLTDGRDTAPEIAQRFTDEIETACRQIGAGSIATVMGRFYAMDRDKRWDRVERAYKAMVYGEGHHVKSAAEAVQKSYANGATDEFIEPSVIVDASDQPIGRIKTGDSVIFFNFRSDRAREICHALSDDDFSSFDRGSNPPQIFLATMTAYDDTLTNAAVAFPPNHPDKTLGRLLSLQGMRQLRLAETEKYAHVTFFFNGGVEKVEDGEDRILIPSPKVRTYYLQPEMSAKLVTDALVDSINSDKYDVIVINFANPDMVGHTGVRDAIIKAVSFIDSCLGRAVAALQAKGGTLLLTADHGNAEQMLENGEPMTAHTTNPVPFILVMDNAKGISLRNGRLEDIAPTILQLLNIEQPPEMTGHSLIIQ